MKGILKRLGQMLKGRQPGFTLVELLVVVGIIVALSAIIVPSVAQFANKGDEGARAGELSSVQSAFDTMMADQGILAVDPQDTATDTAINTFTAEPTGTGTAPLATYLRDGPTQFAYCWDASGRVYNKVGTTYLVATAACA